MTRKSRMPVYLLHRCESANTNANAPGRAYAVDGSERSQSQLRGSEPSLVCQMAAEYASVWEQGTHASLHAKPFAFWKRTSSTHVRTPPLWTDPPTLTRERETAHERERDSGGGQRESGEGERNTEEKERADTLIVFAFSGDSPAYAFSGDAPKEANAIALAKMVKLAACV